MGKFDGVLLVSDFDDTYCTDDMEVHPANFKAVEHFKSQGGRFTLATGRAHRTLAPFLHLAPVNAPVVLSNGAELYDFEKDERVIATTVAETIAGHLEELALRVPEIGLEVYHNDQVYIWNPNPWTLFHLKKAQTGATECPISQMPQPWSKAILHQAPPILLKAQEDILTHWGDLYEAIFSNPHMLELTAKGSTKGGMVLRLAELLGISREHIYCVGNNQNDIPMLKISAIPFAPRNCAQAVKDCGATILPPCGEGAIAALIDTLDGIY